MWNWIYRENVYASKDAGSVMIPYPCQVTVKTINGYASDWDQGSLNGTSMPMLVLVIVRPFKLVLTELMELFFKHSFVCARKWYGINVLYRLSIDYIWSSLLHYVTLCCTSRCVCSSWTRGPPCWEVWKPSRALPTWWRKKTIQCLIRQQWFWHFFFPPPFQVSRLLLCIEFGLRSKFNDGE